MAAVSNRSWQIKIREPKRFSGGKHTNELETMPLMSNIRRFY